jgi:hypothetical protein
VNELQRAMLREHDAVSRGEPGSRKRLAKLQRQYREGRHLIERYPAGATATLIESRPVTSLRPRQEPRRAVARSQDTPPRRPYWQLGEPRDMEVVMPQLKRKTTDPYGPDNRVRAWQSFGHASGTVRAGDVLRGDAPRSTSPRRWRGRRVRLAPRAGLRRPSPALTP